MKKVDVSGYDPKRREFFRRGLMILSGLLAALIGVPAVAYLIEPLVERSKANEVELGPLEELSETPRKYIIKYVAQTGWVKAERTMTLYARRPSPDSDEVVVLSNICTHLGCPVHWAEEEARYFCPCHGGVFDIEGRVLAGPPPRPLDRLKPIIRDGYLYIDPTDYIHQIDEESLLGGKSPAKET